MFLIGRWLVGWLFVTSCLAAACGAEKPRRVGWVDRFGSVQLTDRQRQGLATQISDVQAAGVGRPPLWLEACPETERSAEPARYRGVCGREVQLPADWKLTPAAPMWRGVMTRANRPGAKARQAWLQANRRWDPQRDAPVAALPILLPDSLPSDVVVAQDDRGVWRAGFDWDADLQLEDDECVQFSQTKSTQIVVQAVGESLLVVRLRTPDEQAAVFEAIQDNASEHEDVPPEFVRVPQVEVVVLGGDPRHVPEGSGASLAAGLMKPAGDFSTEFVLLPCHGGPADLAAAVQAAAERKCDAVVVNLDAAMGHPTDVARGLAELSRKHRVPVLVNRPTLLSPNYLVEPARQTLPDIAEWSYVFQRVDRSSLRAAIAELLEVPADAKRQTQAEALAGEQVRPSSAVNLAEGGLDQDQFRKLARGESYIARVPLDAIDGRLTLGDRQAEFTDILVTLYDVDGTRVSGREHSNGIRVDSVWPPEVVRARGGYVIAAPRIFYRGKTVETGAAEVGLAWTQGEPWEVELADEGQVAVQTMRLRRAGDPPSKLNLSAEHLVLPLPQVNASEVPRAVQDAAAGYLHRSSDTLSWWYHEVERGERVNKRHLFQDTRRGDSLGPNRSMQYWVFRESGRIAEGVRGIGDLGDSWPGEAWILVQGVVADGPAPRPPRLLQVESPESNRSLQWRRANAVDGFDPSSGGTSTAVYRGRTYPRSYRRGEMLLGQVRRDDLLEPSVAWWAMSLRRSPSRPTPGWLQRYDHDPIAEALAIRESLGRTPAEILAGVPRPAEGSTDLAAWHRYLVALDHPRLRKGRLEQVIDVTSRILELAERRLGGLPGPEDPYREEMQATMGASASGGPKPYRMPTEAAEMQVYGWAADAAYRRVRAIGYRELPDVVAEHPIEDAEVQDRDFEQAFYRLCGLVPIKDPRFVLTLVRYHRRRGEQVQAYAMLSRYAYEGPAMPWFFKKERDLWSEAGVESLRRLGHARWFLKQAGRPVVVR